MTSCCTLNETDKKEILELRDKFLREVEFAGVYLSEEQTQGLRDMASFKNMPDANQIGIKYWDNTRSLSMDDFIAMMGNVGKEMPVKITRYCKDDRSEGFLARVKRDGYFGDSPPYIALSWSDGARNRIPSVSFSLSSSSSHAHSLSTPEIDISKLNELLEDVNGGCFLGFSRDGRTVDLSSYKEEVDRIIDRRSGYAIYRCYDEETEFGDPQRVRDLLFVTNSKSVAEKFLETYNRDTVTHVTSWGARFHDGIIEIDRVPSIGEHNMSFAFPRIADSANIESPNKHDSRSEVPELSLQ